MVGCFIGWTIGAVIVVISDIIVYKVTHRK